jgi:DNA-binding response OmpR family regulator
MVSGPKLTATRPDGVTHKEDSETGKHRLRENRCSAGDDGAMKVTSKEILLVESDDDSREMVRWYLNDVGYRVRAASTVAESLMLLKDGEFNLYLLGDGCEDGTTLTLCRQLRSIDSETPILFCSAWAYPADRERGISAGAQGYLTKPVDWVDLEQSIIQLIAETPARSYGKKTC